MMAEASSALSGRLSKSRSNTRAEASGITTMTSFDLAATVPITPLIAWRSDSACKTFGEASPGESVPLGRRLLEYISIEDALFDARAAMTRSAPISQATLGLGLANCFAAIR